MFKTAETLDDLMYDILQELLKHPFDIKTSRGTTSEIFGVLLQLQNPRARLSITETRGKPFSALGELMWYLSGTNKLDFIEYYLPKYKKYAEVDETIYGGYGPRLFQSNGGINQIESVIKLLKTKTTTRKAVIQLFDAKDIVKPYKDIPCTCTLQFAIRNKKLNMFTYMRSNDAFIGLPHDVFCFTMLQEIIARTLGFELGVYNHAVGSMHLYDENREQAEQYLSEGYQSTKTTMPEMPHGDPWPAIENLKEAEIIIRTSNTLNESLHSTLNYWEDLISLLMIHSSFKNNSIDSIIELQQKMFSSAYNTYIDSKIKSLKK